ncbi:MAG: 1-(5-phosphoribosyl)-5-[(5-phosphoribosylamino)methylideneamino]imidazole-4-carboxamide isomerase [Solirubrobacterales bacterium]|nr:1-(5-phosphoribosyl)-5-[(5-phosphoribosylamino)methylideneamino]imidazole-4-carboxamide isomerase [Solirubrobacterales bacterium]
MRLYPAIDILEGKAVRLRQGSYDEPTIYADSPAAAALAWADAGARALHVVDLDGARGGSPVNIERVREITSAVDLPLQLGGGLRSQAAVEQALDAGAAKVILGTAALQDTELLDRLIAGHAGELIVSVDSRAGIAAVAGWEESGNVDALSALAALEARGVERLIVSDIEVDGTMAGPNIAQIVATGEVLTIPFIYSGGVGTLADLTAIAAAAPDNLDGVIVGKALYDGAFTIEEAQAALGEE